MQRRGTRAAGGPRATRSLWPAPPRRPTRRPPRAELFTILKATEKLERAWTRDAISAKDYEPACEKLIAQFKTLYETIRDSVCGGVGRRAGGRAGTDSFYSALGGEGRVSAGRVRPGLSVEAIGGGQGAVRPRLLHRGPQRGCAAATHPTPAPAAGRAAQVPDVEAFMITYNMQCPMAATRLLKSGMPATKQHDLLTQKPQVGRAGGGARAGGPTRGATDGGSSSGCSSSGIPCRAGHAGNACSEHALRAPGRAPPRRRTGRPR